jgi:hypothetical protein
LENPREFFLAAELYVNEQPHCLYQLIALVDMTESAIATTKCLDHECRDHDLKPSANKIDDATG